MSYFKQGNIITRTATFTTASGTTTLTATSAENNQFTGTAVQTVVLPDATTLPIGRSFWILNRSTLSVTVNFNGGTLATTALSNTAARFVVINNSTSIGTWDIQTLGANSGTIPISQGGTGQTTKAAAFDALSPMTTSGDIIYGGASGTGTRLAKGSDGQVLTLASGIPSWQPSGSGSFTAPTVQKFTNQPAILNVTGGPTVVVGAVYDYNINGTGIFGFLEIAASSSGSTTISVNILGPDYPGTQSISLVSGSGDALVAIDAIPVASQGGTYTTPTSPAPLYLKVTVSGGGGGAGGGSNGNMGGNGYTTDFGTSLLSATGGTGGVGVVSGGTYSPGGSFTVNSPAINIFAANGGGGNPPGTNNASFQAGGSGGSNSLGGGGAGGAGSGNVQQGEDGQPNTGAGGGGGADHGTNSNGAGGGAGGYIEVYITSPSSTYSYNIGVGGVGGLGNPNSGGSGGSGIIIVEEFYQ